MRAESPSLGSGRPNWLRLWFWLLAVWASFTVLGTWFNYQALLVRNRPISWGEAIRMNLAGYGIWALVLTPLVLFLCARLSLDKENLLKLVPGHLLGIAGVLCIDVCLKVSLDRFVFPDAKPHAFAAGFRRYVFSEAEADIQIYLLIAVASYVVAYYSQLRAQEKHAAELETSLVRAELQVLKMQLQPHFLFNTLHSVAALIRKDPRGAEKMICSLGDLLRLTLAAGDTPKVTLRRELEFLEIYLDIQRVRFHDRLVTTISADDDVDDALVPYVLLQPLVENAIKHGVSRRPGLSRVEVDIRRQGPDLCISVVNEDAESHRSIQTDGLGIGLDNIRNRLRILYESRSELAVRALPGGRFQVEVRIPFEREPVAAAEAQVSLTAITSVMELGQ